MVKTGVVSRTFNGWKSGDAARRIAELGFVSTELCFTFEDAPFWSYNGSCDVSGLTPPLAAEIVKTFRDSGLYVAALGCFTSLFDYDEGVLSSNMAYMRRFLEAAADNGVPAVSTECGFMPGRRGVQADTYEKDFEIFRGSMMKMLEEAEKLGVDIALEPCVLDLVPSAKRAKDFIAQCGSSRLKILLDPANLIANSDEEDMFKYLAGHISYFHGKDRKVNDAYGRVVGDGDIDWPLFMRLYHEKCEGAPFIFEYVTPENCAKVKARLEGFDTSS